jgi:hypothetical protein
MAVNFRDARFGQKKSEAVTDKKEGPLPAEPQPPGQPQPPVQPQQPRRRPTWEELGPLIRPGPIRGFARTLQKAIVRGDVKTMQRLAALYPHQLSEDLVRELLKGGQPAQVRRKVAMVVGLVRKGKAGMILGLARKGKALTVRKGLGKYRRG